MKQIKLLLCVPIISILWLTKSQAQSIYVTTRNGNQTSFNLNSIQKLTFSGEDMTITNVNNTTESFALTFVRCLSFVDISTYQIPLKLKSSDIFLFPNPVDEFLSIHIPSSLNGIIQVLIIGPDGKVIQRQRCNMQSSEMQATINVSSLPKGLYLCRLINDKIITTRKFIKK